MNHQWSPLIAVPHGDPAPVPMRSLPGVLVAALVTGLMLGPLDLLAQTTLPYPWANLANSGAGWALAAFVIGSWAGRSVRICGAAGIVLLSVAVESYYLATVIFLHDSSSTLWNEAAAIWLVLAIVVGAIFGGAGSLLRSSRSGVRRAAATFAGSIFLVEALARIGRPQGGTGPSQLALIELTLAVIVPVLLLTLTRHRRPTR